MTDPLEVPTVYLLELPEPDNAESPLESPSPKEKHTMVHGIFNHMELVDNCATKSRLSYQVWSSMPDGNR